MLGWGITLPFLPLFIREKLGSYTGVGLVYGLLPLLSMMWALLLGSILDRVHKRSAMRVAFFLYLPLSWLLLCVQSFFGFVLFRIYQSALATTYWVSGEAYVRKHSSRGKEAVSMAWWDFASGLALVIGAIIGALTIGYFHWNIFYAVSAFSLLAFLGSWTLPDHDKTPIKRFPSIAKEIKDLWNKKSLLHMTVFSFFFAFGAGVVAMLLPLFLAAPEVGATLMQIGIITSVASTPILFEPYFSRCKKPILVVQLALGFAAVFFISLFFVTNTVILFLIAGLLGLSLAAIAPIMMGTLTRFMPHTQIGELSAVTFAVRIVGSGLGPITAGILSDAYGLQYAFLLCGIIFCGLTICWRLKIFE